MSKLFHTHTHSIQEAFTQLWSTTRGTLEYISHCVVYKTTTNVCCFADGRPHQLQSTWGDNTNHRWRYMWSFLSWRNHWSHDLRWNFCRGHWPVQCKWFLKIIYKREKFSYLILTQNNLFIHPCKSCFNITYQHQFHAIYFFDKS
jgi:hypothetical protein